MLRINSGNTSSLSPYVPLKQINIDATIHSFAADVTITQIFRNDECMSMEVVYSFPIEEQAAIYNFTAWIDNREIVTQLKQKDTIQYTSHRALRSQYNTLLLEQDEHSQDMFIVNLGDLPRSKECKIRISYVTELDLIQGSIIRFVVPTNIAPRYRPKTSSAASQINSKSKYVQSIPYIVEFRCLIEKMYGSNQQPYIAELYSPSHQIDVDMCMLNAYLVTFVLKNTYLDRDILLDIKLSDKRANTFVVVEENAIMAAVTPFEEDCYLTLDNMQTHEFIFILDCSGSMKNDNKIGNAREIVLYCLRNLPKSSYFNIIKFGSFLDVLFGEISVFYNNLHVRIAEQFINQIQADTGGTELLASLKWLECHPPRTGCARQVFLLTDGEIANVSEVLQLCRSMSSSTRIFSFGFGASPSRSLIKGLARTTNGRYIFIPPNISIGSDVMEQLRKTMQRCITNIQVKWNLGVDVKNVPSCIPPAYMNDRLIIYALTKNQRIPLNRKSSLEIRTDQSFYYMNITQSHRITNSTMMIERLAAKAWIRELEFWKMPHKTVEQIRLDSIFDDNKTVLTKEDIKERIINLSLQYNILSTYTTFIGVEKHGSRTGSREIPIQICTSNRNYQLNYLTLNHMPSSISNVDLYSSTLFKDEQFRRTSRDLKQLVETSSTKSSEATNQNYVTDYHERDSPECLQFHYNTSGTKQLSTTTSARQYLTLPNEDELLEQNTSPKELFVSQDALLLMNDKDVVEYLICKQSNDGCWNFDGNRKTIKELTGKSLALFQSTTIPGNTKTLVTAIIIILLEVKYLALHSLWRKAVEKARQCLMNLLNNNSQQLTFLLKHVRMILVR